MKMIVFLVGLLIWSGALMAIPKYKTLEKNVTTAGTQVPLVASATYSSHVLIKAKSTNTGLIYVGDSGVSSANGFILQKNEEVLLGDLQRKDKNEALNLADIYVDSSVNGEGVRVIYVSNRYKGKEPNTQ